MVSATGNFITSAQPPRIVQLDYREGPAKDNSNGVCVIASSGPLLFIASKRLVCFEMSGQVIVILCLMGNDEAPALTGWTIVVSKPAIATAIPLRRYKFGEFTLTVLGDIESPDELKYRYIMAVIQGDDPEPGLYITAEQVKGKELAMRMMMRDGDEVIGHSAQWHDLDAFVNAALDIVARVLNLSDETPYQLV